MGTTVAIRKMIFICVATFYIFTFYSLAEGYKINNDIEIPSKYEIGPVKISPDGKKVAYEIEEKNGSKKAIAVNDTFKQEAHFVYPQSITFSPDSSALGYVIRYVAAEAERSLWVLRNGFPMRVSPKGMSISDGLIFSPDGKKAAYIGFNDQKSFIMVNDKKTISGFDSIAHVAFTPDGAEIIYSAKIGNKWYVMINNRKVSPPLEDISYNEITLIPKSKKVVYLGKFNGKTVLFKDKEVISLPEFDEVIWFTISPDGSKVAYCGIKGDIFEGKRVVVLNNKKVSPEFDFIGDLTFSHDSKKLAFWAFSKESNTSKIFTADELNTLVASPEIKGNRIRDIIFSQNNRDIAYIVGRDGNKVSVFDNELNPKPFFIMLNDAKASPDCTWIAMTFVPSGEIAFACSDSINHKIIIGTISTQNN